MIQLALGIIIMCANGFLYGLVLASAATPLEKVKYWHGQKPGIIRQTSAMSLSILVVMVAHMVSVFIWAAVFILLSIFSTVKDAVYFSLVAYTTLGFGDIILDEPWRILSGIVAANGFLLFGWSTAFQIEFLSDIRNSNKTISN
ncbi:MAG: potassium channel family protein [Pseudomonadota bacterium]